MIILPEGSKIITLNLLSSPRYNIDFNGKVYRTNRIHHRSGSIIMFYDDNNKQFMFHTIQGIVINDE